MEVNVGPVILINKFTVNFLDRFLALRRLIVDYLFIYLFIYLVTSSRRRLILYVNNNSKCFYCYRPIMFDDQIVNQKGKRIPLNPEDHTYHRCGPVRSSSSSPLPTFFGKQVRRFNIIIR